MTLIPSNLVVHLNDAIMQLGENVAATYSVHLITKKAVFFNFNLRK